MSHVVTITLRVQVELDGQSQIEDIERDVPILVLSGIESYPMDPDACRILSIDDPKGVFSKPLDICGLLNDRRQVADLWSIDDIKEIRPDLNDEQAWEVMQRAERNYNLEVGFNWDLFASIADELFETDTDNHDVSA